MNTQTFKTLILGVIFGLTAQVSLFAQPGGRPHPADGIQNRMQEMKAKKIAYLTNAMELTPEEAQTFWPLYNEYDKVMMEFHRNKIQEKAGQHRGQRGSSSELSDADANEKIVAQFKDEQALLDHRKAYYEKFKKVISPAKILKLYDAEMRFRMEIVREFGERERERRR